MLIGTRRVYHVPSKYPTETPLHRVLCFRRGGGMKFHRQHTPCRTGGRPGGAPHAPQVSVTCRLNTHHAHAAAPVVGEPRAPERRPPCSGRKARRPPPCGGVQTTRTRRRTRFSTRFRRCPARSPFVAVNAVRTIILRVRIFGLFFFFPSVYSSFVPLSFRNAARHHLDAR